MKDADTGVVRTNKDGHIIYEEVEFEVTVNKRPIYLLPKELTLNIDTVSQERKRGIFKVPVYTANAEQAFNFDLENLDNHLGDDDKIGWEKGATYHPYVAKQIDQGARPNCWLIIKK